MPTQPKPKVVRSFPITVVHYYEKGKTSSKDQNQMWFPALGSHHLNIDDRGEFFLNDVHYVDFRGISKPVIPSLIQSGLVYVTLAKNKGSGVFEIGIQGATLEELCRLRSPKR